jgi:hypothetical protein
VIPAQIGVRLFLIPTPRMPLNWHDIDIADFPRFQGILFFSAKLIDN